MPELALGLLLLYGAVALGVRLFLHWRRTGSTGFSLPRGGAPERIAAALIAAGLALLLRRFHALLWQPRPTTKDECKDGGWRRFGFKNQGRCVAFVNALTAH
jgi:hypothetical protein